MTLRILVSCLLASAVFLAAAGAAAQVDLSDATVVVDASVSELEVPVEVLVEEVEARTGIAWPVSAQPGPGSIIELRLAAGSDGLRAEGYRIETRTGERPRVVITGADKRGALFGVGHLLRTLSWRSGEAYLDVPLDVETEPAYPIRGHQIGYRARANSWDAWTVDQMEQYFRELAFFGSNSIENIPFQDDQFSPHMKLSRREMNKQMAALCDKYDLDHWVWTPADFDLEDLETRAEHLRLHEELYSDCVRLDAVFFPGGDPGNNHPRLVIPFLEDLAAILAKYHPEAGIWLSLQGFNREETDYFYEWLDANHPEWFAGVVMGPGSPPLDVTRERLDPRYPLRHYPDITHNTRCQYPIPNWDQVFALTAGREAIMPRPVSYAQIHRATAPHTDGFLSYSDGVHDDINKVVWSALAWDSSIELREILKDYARVFFGPDHLNEIADGIFAQETNWDGPIVWNGVIPATLAAWQELEAAHPELSGNWRWQMLLVRAYYDEYQRQRYYRETALEQEANAQLGRRPGSTPEQAMQAALNVLRQADTEPAAPELRARIVQLFDDLFQSIGLQTDVDTYQASGAERGCMLEFLDYPLNNRWWLEDEFEAIAAMRTDAEKWARLEEIRTWENPGPGSFYDNLGSIAHSPRVIWELGTEPRSGGHAWWDNGYSRERLSWQVNMWPQGLDYPGLDPDARYTLRFVGFGDMKVYAGSEEIQPVRYGTENGEVKEYPVPEELVKNGRFRVLVERQYGGASRGGQEAAEQESVVPAVTVVPTVLSGVNWRFQPRLSEVWLVKH